ncbi:hypothetical protein EXIGLDRAFT_609908 [Exidia glandulosa HHB12029]|uniref:UbiA prenyltransferase n=1 Tax=Exidia glandulosa HHB12029 TaxID=1314781 RepID=A0A166AX09_EXIGL|nr:hypothetical protein EXIGLDRAFT_609908 [Exidia glandulosa HHB12029]
MLGVDQLHTIFLFVYSDFNTTFFPIGLFAMAVAPAQSVSKAMNALAWLLLHLLAFNVANQYTSRSIEEDALNKPWRPLPSGRISRDQATILRWALVVICTLASITIAGPGGPTLIVISVAFSLATLVYNEGGVSTDWTGKNLCCSVGNMLFESGTTLVMGDADKLSDTARLAIALSGMIAASTIHVQDFPDVEGDRALGRHTLPLTHPRFARIATSNIILAWSFILGVIWALHPVLYVAFALLGALVSYGVLYGGDIAYDKRTYILYNVWLSTAHLLPLACKGTP